MPAPPTQKGEEDLPVATSVAGPHGAAAQASSIDPYSYAHGADTVSYTRIGKWEADLAERAGLVLWDRVLLYVKGGVGFTKIASSLTDTCAAAPCGPATLVATGRSSSPFWVGGAGI